MKLIIDNESRDYIEAKEGFKNGVDLSIRTKNDDGSITLITTNLSQDILDKLIANLIYLKSKVINEKK